MSRRKNPKRGSSPKSKKPRNPTPIFRPTKGGIKHFGDGAGTSSEYQFRRKYPLLDSDVEHLTRFSTGVIKRQRKRGQWFFISLQVKTIGGLYETTFALIEEDEKPVYQRRWVSTHSINNLRKLRQQILFLVEEVIAFHVRSRPAWILRVRVTTFTPSNPRGIGKVKKTV